MRISGKIAMPFTADCVGLPVMAAPPGLFASARVIEAVDVTGLPTASSTRTRIGGAMAVFTSAPDGCVMKASRAAGPVIDAAVKVTGASDAADACTVCSPSGAPSVHVVDATPTGAVALVVVLGEPTERQANVEDLIRREYREWMTAEGNKDGDEEADGHVQ